MTPCSACARHVKHDETACPFCGTPFTAPAPRNLRVVGRVTRAAVFSAALVACSKHEEPKPKAGSAEHLDQDFNQLLGSAEPGSAAVAASADAAVAVAPDAGTDAALTDEERTRQLQHAQDQQREEKQREQRQREQRAQDELRRREIEQQQLRQQQHYNAKPYGAPPARRRVV